jgi:hypothetical protein
MSWSANSAMDRPPMAEQWAMAGTGFRSGVLEMLRAGHVGVGARPGTVPFPVRCAAGAGDGGGFARTQLHAVRGDDGDGRDRRGSQQRHALGMRLVHVGDTHRGGRTMLLGPSGKAPTARGTAV